MKLEKYRNLKWMVIFLPAIMLLTQGCKKDKMVTDVVKPASLATLGLYQYTDGTNKRIFIPIAQVGAQKVSYFGIFDTGSSGLTIDANGILPASMITSTGIQLSGDSVNVNGITVTSRTGTLSFGDQTGTTREYGNLAYANVTLGNQNGSLTTKRIAFFLYYKIVDGTGKQLPAHSADVFGVGPGTSYVNAAIKSPLDGLTLPANVTSGFKLATLAGNSFSTSGTFVGGLLTLGLVPDDLSSSSGFIMHPLTYNSNGGYSPNIPSTITYNGQSISAQVLFDTGTPSITTIENFRSISTKYLQC